MPKLTYWVCRQSEDSQCYNIRAKTKKEALALKAKYERPSGDYPTTFEEPVKCEVFYRSAFDLLVYCLSEARGGE
jgi:hypothetical protein